MTTIAWDGQFLAADRRVTFGTVADAETTKIAENMAGDLCAATGSLQQSAAFLRWFQDGERGECFSFGMKEDNSAALIVRRDGVLELHNYLGWAFIKAPFFAMGSGGDFATAAMACGIRAENAVRLAARFDTATGDEVDVLELKPPTTVFEFNHANQAEAVRK